MDSKRLFTFIALLLVLSCVLLDHAKGFIQPRKMRKYKQKKRDPPKNLERNTREMIAFVFQILVCMLNMIYQSSNVSLYKLPKRDTVIKGWKNQVKPETWGEGEGGGGLYTG